VRPERTEDVRWLEEKNIKTILAHTVSSWNFIHYFFFCAEELLVEFDGFESFKVKKKKKSVRGINYVAKMIVFALMISACGPISGIIFFLQCMYYFSTA